LRTRILILVIAFWLPFYALSQQYSAIRYDIANGLPTELLKAVIEDQHGFIWVASDAGMARFDGSTFISYVDALPSQYVKQFCMTKDNRLFVVSDMGMTEIISRPDTVRFLKFLEGSIRPEDNKVNYPKDLYVDKNNEIWVSEPVSLLRISGNTSKRYFFPQEHASSSFFRSFCVTEDHIGRLWATSYSGGLFLYHPEKDKFVEIKLPEKVSEISCISPTKNKLLIGAKEGLYEFGIESDEFVINFKKLSNINNISDIIEIDENTYFLGSFSDNLHICRITEWGWEEEPFMGLQRVKHIYKSKTGEIWVSTDAGLLLLQPNFFQKVTFQTSNTYHYTESVGGSGETMYAIIKNSIFKLEKKKGKYMANEMYFDPNAYFLSLSCKEEGKFWVTSRSELILFENDKVSKVYSFAENDNQYLFYVYEDNRKNIWFRQEGLPGLFQLSNAGKIKRYDAVKGLPVRTEVIKSSFKTGNIYVGGIDSLNYLFQYDLKSDSFINISKPLPFKVKTGFIIKDLCVDDRERIWLATTEGLLCYDNGNVQRINLGKEHTTLPSRAISVSSFGKIWFANTHGLLMYSPEDEQYIVFDENTGLPSKTVSRNGVFIKYPYQKWVATSKGLAYMDVPMREFPETPKPLFTNVLVNGNSQMIEDSLFILPHDAYLSVSYVCLSFPGNEVEYQTRMFGIDSQWIEPTTKHDIVFPRLQNGDYTLEIRAKKKGGYRWSKPSRLHFKVQKPWFMHSWAFLLFACGGGFLWWGVVTVNSWRVRKAQEHLSQLVAQRTQELQQTNQELTQTNKELDMFVYSTSHDLRAPLTSLMGLINITRLEKDEMMRKTLLEMMEKSVQNLDKFIGDILDYSRNSRLQIIPEEIDFEKLIKEILNTLKFAQGSENIERILDIEQDEISFKSDKTRLKIILNNLISNAIRYSDLDKEKPYIKVIIRTFLDRAIIKIEDNGIGIAKEYQSRVFEMFYRATERNTGSGLGLYIVRETAKALSSEITLQSELGKGTTFTLILPNLKS
jgi:signal transduction histidine kinase/streptogramin lyase